MKTLKELIEEGLITDEKKIVAGMIERAAVRACIKMGEAIVPLEHAYRKEDRSGHTKCRDFVQANIKKFLNH